MYQKTVAELSRLLHDKQISSTELTRYFLDRIHQHNPRLNSFITTLEENALLAAKAADQQIERHQAKPLTGIPIAHKDIFCTQGVKTSCGSKMLDNFISPYDATVVSKLKNAGTVLLGKTNMDEFAMGSSTETSFYGPSKNPWDIERVPGGSSGGSASAVAARIVPAATGTDTGGSIRQPASFCGITGLKPTYGRVSRHGIIAFASSLDQAGIFSKTAEDAALMLNEMAGFDSYDSTSVAEAAPDYTASLNHSLQGLKIGLPKEFFSKDLDASIAEVISNAAKEFEKLGAIIEEISLPNISFGIPVYYIIAPAECSSNLARYDGVRYGYRCKDPKDLLDLYERTRAEGFGDEVKRRIFIGTYVLSSGYYDAYYIKAQKVRRLIKNDFVEAFKKVDVILTPTTPSTAFKLGEENKNHIHMYLNDIYTVTVNLAGLPGVSIPAGFLNQLPIGMQLIGHYFDEARLLNFAHRYQQATDWHRQIPHQFL